KNYLLHRNGNCYDYVSHFHVFIESIWCYCLVHMTEICAVFENSGWSHVWFEINEVSILSKPYARIQYIMYQYLWHKINIIIYTITHIFIMVSYKTSQFKLIHIGFSWKWMQIKVEEIRKKTAVYKGHVVHGNILGRVESFCAHEMKTLASHRTIACILPSMIQHVSYCYPIATITFIFILSISSFHKRIRETTRVLCIDQATCFRNL
ncbi:hypothetical protein ACJX0J_014962, partial [Zea mays]